MTEPIIILADPVAVCRMRLKDARVELKKHPSYGNAATVQQLERQFKTLVSKRRDDIRTVYDFHGDLLDNVELKLLGLL